MSPRAVLPTAAFAAAWLLAFGPAPAAACIWNTSHGFNPLPPCEVDDMPGRERIHQINTQLIGTLTSAAYHIREVQREVRQWRRAIAQAENYRRRAESYYGRMTANPLPSMVATYNRESPMAAYFQLNLDGDFKLSLTPVDLFASADSIRRSFADSLALRVHYKDMFTKRLEATVAIRRHHLQKRALQRVENVVSYRQYVNLVSDSLKSRGDEFAKRYASEGLPDGLAEIKLSRLSASLSRLHGTALDAQVRGTQARMQGHSGMTDQMDRAETYFVLRAPKRF
jgi:hypothetical protein